MACTEIRPYLTCAVIVLEFFLRLCLFFGFGYLVLKHKVLQLVLFCRRKLSLLFLLHSGIFCRNSAGCLDYLLLIVYVQRMRKCGPVAVYCVERYRAVCLDIFLALLRKIPVQLLYKIIGRFLSVIFLYGSVVAFRIRNRFFRNVCGIAYFFGKRGFLRCNGFQIVARYTLRVACVHTAQLRNGNKLLFLYLLVYLFLDLKRINKRQHIVGVGVLTLLFKHHSAFFLVADDLLADLVNRLGSFFGFCRLCLHGFFVFRQSLCFMLVNIYLTACVRYHKIIGFAKHFIDIALFAGYFVYIRVVRTAVIFPALIRRCF